MTETKLRLDFKSPHGNTRVLGRSYFLLILIALFCLMGVNGAFDHWVIGKYVHSRLQGVESLIRSNDFNLLLQNTRPLRDQLVEQGSLKVGTELKLYSSQQMELPNSEIRQLLQDCQRFSATICSGKNYTLFTSLNRDTGDGGYRYLIQMNTDLTAPPLTLLLVKFGLIAILSLLFVYLFRELRSKETFLLDKLALNSQGLQAVEHLFLPARSSVEFQGRPANALQSVSDLKMELDDHRKKIQEYRDKLVRRTRLEQLGKTVGQIGHDLKAPLAEAALFLENLPVFSEKVEPLTLRKNVESLVGRLRKGLESIDGALKNTKNSLVQFETVDLIRFLEDLRKQILSHPKFKNVRVHMQSSESELFIHADTSLLERVFYNLLTNAVESREDCDVWIEIHKQKNGKAEICVLDNGPGIQKEYLNTIFEPLFKLRMGGTGLGLSSSRDIIEQHGGKIVALESKSGAEFQISIPLLSA